MKTIILIGITAIALVLPACTGYEHADAPETRPATTSSVQHGTLLQSSTYDAVNRVGQ